MATIEIEVGELHKELHEQLSNVQDEYDLLLRDEVEDLIHNQYQKVERAQEQRHNIVQKEVEDSDDE